MNLNRKTERLLSFQTQIQWRLDQWRNSRMIVLLLGISFLATSSYLKSAPLLVLSVLLLTVGFPVLVWRTRQLFASTLRIQQRREFYERAQLRLLGTFQEANPYKPEKLEDQRLSRDLDVFGAFSLFSQLDETQLQSSQKLLAQWIVSGHQTLADIQLTQRQISQLMKQAPRLLKLKEIRKQKDQSRLNDLVISEVLSESLTSSNYPKFVLLGSALWILSIAVALVHSMTQISLGSMTSLVFLLGYWMIGLSQLGTFVSAFQKSLSMEANLRRFAGFLVRLENESLKSQFWIFEFPEVFEFRLSKQLKSMSLWTDFLSIQANPLVFLFLNAIFPWSLIGTYQLEKKRRLLKADLEKKLPHLIRFDTLCSLALFAKFQTQCFPSVLASPEMHFKDLSHPLIALNGRVANSFDFHHKKLILITGSNMSGKSTFLRAVGLNHLLAQAGAPVYASKMTTFRGPLLSCIRVADSVEEGFSYFFAEVKRVKKILDETQKSVSSLYMIDEIFKGTNNRERLLAAQFLMKTLSLTQSRGFITTHDLELTELAKDNKDIENYHFADDVMNDQMVFSYKIKDGPCLSTNALKILRNEGIQIS